MKTVFIRVVIFLAVLNLAHAQPIKLTEKEMGPILGVADKAQIRERIKFLADDKLRGRFPGTPGFQMAVDFVLKELNTIGIKPKDDKGFLQTVSLRKAAIDSAGSPMTMTFADGDRKLKYGRDYSIAPDLNRISAAGDGDLVFVGFGIVAPHLKHDDYKDMNVRGKVVVIREGTPEEFPAGEKAHFNLPVSKCDEAGKRGAVGVIMLIGGEETQRMATLARTSVDGTNGFVKPDGTAYASRANGSDPVKFLAYVRASLIPEASGLSPQALTLKASVKVSGRHTEFKSENIIGVIPGTDPVLKNEFVVHTAHLDHVGVGTPVRGDSIYNGAHDNASGTACLLEIAKLYTKAKLKRSVMIIFVTLEERGLLGSGYFANNPTVPKEKIVANINTDMPTIIAPLLSIEPLGASHSSLMNEVKNAAAYLKLDVVEDHMPEQVRFVRSDQYSFIRQGIPALHVKYGLKTSDPAVDLRKKIDEWTAAHYHKPSDEFSDEAFDFDAALTYVRLNFLIGYQVANTKARPRWNDGDFFGKTFAVNGSN